MRFQKQGSTLYTLDSTQWLANPRCAVRHLRQAHSKPFSQCGGRALLSCAFAYGIEAVELADGTVLDLAQIEIEAATVNGTEAGESLSDAAWRGGVWQRGRLDL